MEIARRKAVRHGEWPQDEREPRRGFWTGMKEIAAGRSITLSELVAEIDKNRKQGNLSSAPRLYVLEFYQKRSTN